jgi:hypothetical protein
MLVIGAWGLATLVLGLWLLPPQLALNAPPAIDAIFAQLPVTLPAAILVVGAAAINLGTAGLLVQRILPAAERSLAGVVLAAYGGAVLLDVALLYVLGGLGLFTLPVLVVVHGGLFALGWVIRRPVRRPLVAPIHPHLGWGLVAIVWSAPLLLQLASPVVPFADVLPNLVAPVEHLRTFAHFDPLTTSPSPIYGPSRLSLGYIGLLGTVATLSGQSAAQAISSFIAVEVALVAVAVAALARTAAGRSAVFWALIAFAMTQPFARITDDRSRILAIPIVALVVMELVRGTRHETASARTAWAIGLGLGATLLMHAVIGALLMLVLLVLFATSPWRHRAVVVGVAVAGSLALPQAAVVLGIAVPSMAAVIVVPIAIGAGLAIARLAHSRRGLERTARIAVLVTIALMVAGAGLMAPAFVRWFSDFGPAVPLLAMTGLVGLTWVRPSARRVLVAMLGVGVLAGTLANVAPADSDSLLWQAVRYEVPKEVHTWLPVVLALSSAAALAQVIRRFPPAGWLHPGWGLAVAAAWLVVAAVPLRVEPIDGFHVGERHLSENLAIQLRYAETGYWTGYPDARRVVDEGQRRVLAAIRKEIAAGRITATTHLLHIARTYQQWGAIPVGVFTGVLETDVSPDSRLTIHTVGGRLVPMDGLRVELAGDYDYLLVEWRDLPPNVAQLIGGFEPIFTTKEAQLLRRRD